MKYNPPLGASGVNDPYIDGSPETAVEGSIVPAAMLEYTQREIVNVITKSKGADIAEPGAPDNGDLYQLLKSIRSGYPNFAVDTGSANSLSIALDPALGLYRQGMPLRVLVKETNTGAATINVNGLGARPIKRSNGAALVAGDIVSNGIANLVDDGTNFQLTNYLGATSGTVNNYVTDIPYAEVTGTANALVANFAPDISWPPVAGDLILIKVASVNTDAVTIAIDGQAAAPIYRNDGTPMLARDLVAGEAILLEFHSTYWQMMRLVRSQVFLKLAADLTIWIRTDGNDSNDGSANDASHAFATIDAAVSYVRNSFLVGGRSVQFRLGIAGTYTGAANFTNLNGGNFTLLGDNSNRANYIVSYAPNTNNQQVLAVGNCQLSVQGLTLYNGTAGYHTAQFFGGASASLSNVRFSGVSGTSAAVVAWYGANVTLSNYIDVWNNCGSALWATIGGSITIGQWFTSFNNNSVAYSGAFAAASSLGIVSIDPANCGFAGMAFGPRFSVLSNSVINVGGYGPYILPGGTDGYADSSSFYG